MESKVDRQEVWRISLDDSSKIEKIVYIIDIETGEEKEVKADE